MDSLDGLLANDTDINGDKLYAYKDSDPKVLADGSKSDKSSVTINENGSFTYTHGGGEDPYDYFLYYANDGICDSDPDTVKIRVIPQNDCPVTRTNGYNSLSLLGGAPIKDYIEALKDLNGNSMNFTTKLMILHHTCAPQIPQGGAGG